MKKHISLILLVLISKTGFTQEKSKPFDTDRIQFGVYAQLWLRHTDLNPGTLIRREPHNQVTDVSVRRLRIAAKAKISNEVYFFLSLGGNNYNQRNDKQSPIGLLDLYAEYRPNDLFQIGLGKSSWQGLSRWNIRSAKTQLSLDSPLFIFTTLNKSDDLGRSFGAWIKGQWRKWDYRVVANQPYYTEIAKENGVDFSTNKPHIKWSGYLKYQFFETESNHTAYSTGTYLHHKKILNLGGGFMFQKNAMQNSMGGIVQHYYNMSHYAVDFYYNTPLSTGSKKSITAFLGYYNYDFGPGYYRNIAADNIATGENENVSFNGPGNGFPMLGTGGTIYTQFGYSFPVSNYFLQPNLAVQLSNWDLLQDYMATYDLGINFYLNGQNNKLSLGVQFRPIFFENQPGIIEKSKYKSMAVLQYQIGF
ncbi:MAG: porin [Flavobacteriaceae bacterium]